MLAGEFKEHYKTDELADKAMNSMHIKDELLTNHKNITVESVVTNNGEKSTTCPALSPTRVSVTEGFNRASLFKTNR